MKKIFVFGLFIVLTLLLVIPNVGNAYWKYKVKYGQGDLWSSPDKINWAALSYGNTINPNTWLKSEPWIVVLWREYANGAKNYTYIKHEYGPPPIFFIPNYHDPAVVIDSNGLGTKFSIVMRGPINGDSMYTLLRCKIVEVYCDTNFATTDSIGYQLWFIQNENPNYSSKARIWNYSYSKASIKIRKLIGPDTTTVTTLTPGKAAMLYPDASLVTAVELASFNAKGENGLIALSWVTGNELDNAGFNLYRSTSLDGEYTKLNSELIPASANAFEGASYSYTDKEVQTGLTYYYKLEDLSLDGTGTFHGPVSAKVSVTLPSNFALAQNYPNPFNASTMISYDLKTDSKVSLKVYNILGQEVVTLVDKYQTAGSYSVTWNGKDSRGNDLSTGVYFYILKAGDFSANKKMTYLK